MKLAKNVIYIISAIFLALLISTLLTVTKNFDITTNDTYILGITGHAFHNVLMCLTNASFICLIISIINYYDLRRINLKELHFMMIELYDATNRIAKESDFIRKNINHPESYKYLERSHREIFKLRNVIFRTNYKLSKLEINTFLKHTNLSNAIESGTNTYGYLSECLDLIDYTDFILNEYNDIDNTINTQKKLTVDVDIFLAKRKIIISNLEDYTLRLFCEAERIKMLSHDTLSLLYDFNKEYDGIGDIETFIKEPPHIVYDLKLDANKGIEAIKLVKETLQIIEKESTGLFVNGIYTYEQAKNNLLAFINEAKLVPNSELVLNKVKEVYFKYIEILDIINILLNKKDDYLSTMLNEIAIEEKKNYINNIKEVKLINSLTYSLNNYINENRILTKLKED